MPVPTAPQCRQPAPSLGQDVPPEEDDDSDGGASEVEDNEGTLGLPETLQEQEEEAEAEEEDDPQQPPVEPHSADDDAGAAPGGIANATAEGSNEEDVQDNKLADEPAVQADKSWAVSSCTSQWYNSGLAGTGVTWLYAGRLRHQNKPEEFTFRERPGPFHKLRVLEPMSDETIVRFLQKFGFSAADTRAWSAGSEVELHVSVPYHTEVDQHTWYALHCHLTRQDAEGWHWQVDRRLKHLRKFLHDPIKVELGARSYDNIFASTRFAPHGGVVGTTGRLNAWLTALAEGINKCQLTPTTAARTLHFLEAPEVTEAL